MTQKKQAIAYVCEFMELDGELDGEKTTSIDLQTAKKIALIMAQKLQDTQAKQPIGYMSSYDYWEGIKNEIKTI